MNFVKVLIQLSWVSALLLKNYQKNEKTKNVFDNCELVSISKVLIQLSWVSWGGAQVMAAMLGIILSACLKQWGV